MFIFNRMRQENGWCESIARGPFILSAATVGFTTSLALSNGITPTTISLHNQNGVVNSTCGVFKSNVGVNSLTLGEKTFQLNGADFHSPISVKLFAQSDNDSQKFVAVSDSTIGTKQGAFQFALSKDIQQVPGMTSLDVSQSCDLGRMLAPTGTRTTRTQIFLSLPERDNNTLAYDKTPELILMGGVPNGTIKITPILAGNAEIQESLIFGRTLDIEPSDIVAGKTGISILADGANPRQVCVVGLDLSGDLGVGAEHTVVGYQLECPAGSNTAIKLIAVGTQESAVFASDAPSLDMIPLGSMDLLQEPSYTIYAQALPPGFTAISAPLANFDSQPPMLSDQADISTKIVGPIENYGNSGPTDFSSATSDFGPDIAQRGSSPVQSYDDGSGSGLPPGDYAPPPDATVPAPGAIALLGIAAGFMARRRNIRTQR